MSLNIYSLPKHQRWARIETYGKPHHVGPVCSRWIHSGTCRFPRSAPHTPNSITFMKAEPTFVVEQASFGTLLHQCGGRASWHLVRSTRAVTKRFLTVRFHFCLVAFSLLCVVNSVRPTLKMARRTSVLYCCHRIWPTHVGIFKLLPTPKHYWCVVNIMRILKQL